MRAMIDPIQRTTGRPPGPPEKGTGWACPRDDGTAHPGPPRKGTGWAPPRDEGSAHPDSLAQRMKHRIMVFPESVHIAHPKVSPKLPTSAQGKGARRESLHN